MAIVTTFCSECDRDVYLAEKAPPSCPVCSSPLINSRPDDQRESVGDLVPAVPSEIYLG